MRDYRWLASFRYPKLGKCQRRVLRGHTKRPRTRPMRILIDSLTGLMLVAVVVCVVVLYRGQQEDQRSVEAVTTALDRLHEQAAYHTAVQSAMQGHDTLLVHVQQGWFGDNLPINTLVGAECPWIDLAPPGDLSIHPPDPVATDRHQAGFWYNPTTGVFRARVTPLSSEAQTLALYNEVNASSLQAFEQIPDPARKPIAHRLGSIPVKQYASLANKTWSESRPEETEQLFEQLAEDIELHKQAVAAAEPTNTGSAGSDAGSDADQASTPEFVPELVTEIDTSRPTLR